MNKHCDATIQGNKLYLNGMTKWFVGALWGVVIIVMTTLATNVIANDKESRKRDDAIKEMAQENKAIIYRMESKMDSIIDNQNEFKTILKRSAPYQRKENFQ